MNNISPNFPEYELIDSGNGEKLEIFGQQIVARPEPQAIWNKALPQSEWDKLASAYFIKGKNSKYAKNSGDEWGEWELKPHAKEQWPISYQHKDMKLQMRLGLTSFKHVGIFPEQAANWDFIYDTIKSFDSVQSNVLNLFAYTGGASLAAKAAGANVTHVDSVKQVVNWSRENMELSHLDNIRWIVDDAVKFVSREVRRNSQYNGIILDPPAYGRGPSSEKWILEEQLYELLQQCSKILIPKNSFIILNLYSLGYSPLIAENLIQSAFAPNSIESGELYIVDRAKRKLPLGIYARTKL